MVLIGLMLRIDVLYASILLLAFPVMASCYRVLAKRVGRLTAGIEQVQDSINTHMEEMLLCNASLRANNAAGWFAGQVDGLFADSFEKKRERIKVETVYDFALITGLMNLLSVAVYYFGGLFAIQGRVTLGMVVSMSLYYSKLWSPMEFYLDYPKEKAKYKAHRQRIEEVMREGGEGQREASRSNLGKQALEPLSSLRVNGLTYSIGDRRILQDARLEIQAGDRIGIMGDNGCGKSTFANLLCALLQDYEGEILYNGRDYRTFSPDSIREHVCLIPATPQLFQGTIRENIALGGDKEIPACLLGIFEKNVFPWTKCCWSTAAIFPAGRPS